MEVQTEERSFLSSAPRSNAPCGTTRFPTSTTDITWGLTWLSQFQELEARSNLNQNFPLTSNLKFFPILLSDLVQWEGEKQPLFLHSMLVLPLLVCAPGRRKGGCWKRNQSFYLAGAVYFLSAQVALVCSSCSSLCWLSIESQGVLHITRS